MARTIARGAVLETTVPQVRNLSFSIKPHVHRRNWNVQLGLEGARVLVGGNRVAGEHNTHRAAGSTVDLELVTPAADHDAERICRHTLSLTHNTRTRADTVQKTPCTL